MLEDLILAEINTQGLDNSLNDNFTALENAVNTKAEINGDSTKKFNVADAAELTEAINKGQLDSLAASINTSISNLDAIAATKADKTYVDTNLALKANSADVEAMLATKANKNGDINEIFNVANAIESADAVNKGQLDASVSTISDTISGLQEEVRNTSSKVIFCMNSGNVDSNGNADLLYAPGSEIAEANWTQPLLTSNGTLGQGDFSVAAVNINTGNGNRPAYFAFDGNGGTFTDFVQPFNTSVEKSIIMYSDVAIKILSLTIIQSLYCIVDFDLWGSNDGMTYTKIGSYATSKLQNGTENIFINSNVHYKYHKIWLTSGYNTSNGIQYVMPVQININATHQVSRATNCLFKVGDLYPDLTIIYADKSKEILASLEPIQELTTNGNYVVIKEKGQNPVAISHTRVTQGKVFPNSSLDGDYHCLTTTELKTYKRISGEWVETQYVSMGSIIVVDGFISDIITNSYNQNRFDVNFQTPGFRFPDYSNGVSITYPLLTSPYVVPCDGWYVTCFRGDSNTVPNILYINGVISAWNNKSNTSYAADVTQVVPLSRGDVIYWNRGYGSIFSSIFYPVKGAN